MSRRAAWFTQLGLVAGLAALLLVPVNVVSATDNATTGQVESILISPASKKYELKAGEAQEDKLRVVNDGQLAYDFTVYTRPYSVNDESYVPDFTAEAQNADAYKWVRFQTTSFRLEPGAFIEVPYTIRVPAGATPGGHYGVIFAETQPGADLGGQSVVRKKRVGSIIYATVDGYVSLSGKSLGVNVPFFQTKTPLYISERIRNGGNTDFTVKTNVVISDIFGGVKYRGVRDATVLPSTTRNIVSNWQDPSWIGFYRVTYSSEFLDTKQSSVHYVLFVPVWVYLVLAILILGRVGYALIQRKKK